MSKEEIQAVVRYLVERYDFINDEENYTDPSDAHFGEELHDHIDQLRLALL